MEGVGLRAEALRTSDARLGSQAFELRVQGAIVSELMTFPCAIPTPPGR